MPVSDRIWNQNSRQENEKSRNVRFQAGKFEEHEISVPEFISKSDCVFFVILRTYITKVRFQIISATRVKVAAFWDVTPCSLVGNGRCFREAYNLHHQCDLSPLKRRSDHTAEH
jgi:hypothetical protein